MCEDPIFDLERRAWCPICNRQIAPKVKTAVANGVLVHEHCFIHLKETYGSYWDMMLKQLMKK